MLEARGLHARKLCTYLCGDPDVFTLKVQSALVQHLHGRCEHAFFGITLTIYSGWDILATLRAV